MLSKINFVVNKEKIKEMAYGDSVYAWLLLHSHYSPDENHNYIYENEFTFTQIGKDIHRTRQTVSTRFKELLSNSELNITKNLLYYDASDKAYILPCFREFEELDADTVLNLFWLYGQGNTSKKEELIKTYAWLRHRFKERNGKQISYNDLMDSFGHSKGNEQTYQRYKDIMTTLQGAGLIKFRTDNYRDNKGKYSKTFYIYEVNKKASQEWVDKKKEEN